MLDKFKNDEKIKNFNTWWNLYDQIVYIAIGIVIIIICYLLWKYCFRPDDEDNIYAEEARCMFCLPLKPTLQLVICYYILSTGYCVSEVVRSLDMPKEQAPTKFIFAGIYAVLVIFYILILLYGMNWMCNDKKETRVHMINALIMKIIGKTLVDIAMITHIMMMPPAFIYQRIYDRSIRAKLTSKFDRKTAILCKHGLLDYV